MATIANSETSGWFRRAFRSWWSQSNSEEYDSSLAFCCFTLWVMHLRSIKVSLAKGMLGSGVRCLECFCVTWDELPMQQLLQGSITLCRGCSFYAQLTGAGCSYHHHLGNDNAWPLGQDYQRTCPFHAKTSGFLRTLFKWWQRAVQLLAVNYGSKTGLQILAPPPKKKESEWLTLVRFWQLNSDPNLLDLARTLEEMTLETLGLQVWVNPLPGYHVWPWVPLLQYSLLMYNWVITIGDLACFGLAVRNSGIISRDLKGNPFQTTSPEAPINNQSTIR